MLGSFSVQLIDRRYSIINFILCCFLLFPVLGRRHVFTVQVFWGEQFPHFPSRKVAGEKGLFFTVRFILKVMPPNYFPCYGEYNNIMSPLLKCITHCLAVLISTIESPLMIRKRWMLTSVIFFHMEKFNDILPLCTFLHFVRLTLSCYL